MGEGKSANSLWNATPTTPNVYCGQLWYGKPTIFVREAMTGKRRGGFSFEHYQSCVAQQTFLWPICLSGGIQSVFNGLIVFFAAIVF